MNEDPGVGTLVATVESELELKLAETEARLAAAETAIAELRASATATVTYPGRKTLAAAEPHLLSKQGEAVSLEAGALDAALSSLSLEQRIAVKAQLLRAGLVG